MKKNMTDEVVKVASDCECPICGSSSIEFDTPDFEDGAVYIGCTCNECGSGFTFCYSVVDAYITYDGSFDEDNE